LATIPTSRLLAIRLFMFSIGVGVEIGIGIEPCCILRRILMNSIASLSDFHQDRHDAIGQGTLSMPIPIATPTPILLRQHR
jgi:hypothetical protein